MSERTLLWVLLMLPQNLKVKYQSSNKRDIEFEILCFVSKDRLVFASMCVKLAYVSIKLWVVFFFC